MAPYSYQWQYQWPRGSDTWVSAAGPGTTTLSATIVGLGPAAKYNVRLQFTDSTSDVVVSNVLTVTTKALGWYSGMSARRPDRNWEGPNNAR